MNRKLLLFSFLPLLGLSACIGGTTSAGSPSQSVTFAPPSSPSISITNTDTKQNWDQVVRDTIKNELDEEAKDTSLWCYHKLQEKDGKQRLYTACQAKGAEIDRLLAVNGKILDEKQREAENHRIESLLKNQRQLEKQARQQHDDATQATNMLKLIPDAFLYQMEGREGDQVKLNFTPNPAFRPSGHEAEVFHHMEGTLVLDLKEKRLAEINGRLDSAVKFGGGLLGHLDKGGTFVVKQQEVGPGVWEVTTLDVQMNGKALFFKTITVRQKESDSEFKALPHSVTIQQAAMMTKNKIVEVSAPR